MKKMILAITISAFFGPHALASSWNYISGNDEASYYFDADTVEKNVGITTLWVKIVQIKAPMSDGSWANAVRWRFNCSKRTVQLLAFSSYSSDGKYMDSENTAGSEKFITPDSMGDSISKISCKANFPRDDSRKDYFKVPNNDVFQFTRDLFEYSNKKQDNAPK